MFERAVDWWFRWVIALPLTLFAESKHRVVRVIAVPAMVVWYPFLGLGAIAGLVLLVGMMVEELWRKPL